MAKQVKKKSESEIIEALKRQQVLRRSSALSGMLLLSSYPMLGSSRL